MAMVATLHTHTGHYDLTRPFLGLPFFKPKNLLASTANDLNLAYLPYYITVPCHVISPNFPNTHLSSQEIDRPGNKNE